MLDLCRVNLMTVYIVGKVDVRSSCSSCVAFVRSFVRPHVHTAHPSFTTLQLLVWIDTLLSIDATKKMSVPTHVLRHPCVALKLTTSPIFCSPYPRSRARGGPRCRSDDWPRFRPPCPCFWIVLRTSPLKRTPT